MIFLMWKIRQVHAVLTGSFNWFVWTLALILNHELHYNKYRHTVSSFETEPPTCAKRASFHDCSLTRIKCLYLFAEQKNIINHGSPFVLSWKTRISVLPWTSLNDCVWILHTVSQFFSLLRVRKDLNDSFWDSGKETCNPGVCVCELCTFVHNYSREETEQGENTMSSVFDILKIVFNRNI